MISEMLIQGPVVKVLAAYCIHYNINVQLSILANLHCLLPKLYSLRHHARLWIKNFSAANCYITYNQSLLVLGLLVQTEKPICFVQKWMMWTVLTYILLWILVLPSLGIKLYCIYVTYVYGFNCWQNYPSFQENRTFQNDLVALV